MMMGGAQGENQVEIGIPAETATERRGGSHETVVLRAQPGRRWYETAGGVAASEAIRAHLGRVLDTLNRDAEGALLLLTRWESFVNVAALSPEALASIRSAVDDASNATRRGYAEDARAFIHAALCMLH
jgi:hypothetical protein